MTRSRLQDKDNEAVFMAGSEEIASPAYHNITGPGWMRSCRPQQPR